MRKRYAAELIGTFAIVFVPVAFSTVARAPSLTVSAALSGLIVLVMIYALGPISAAHFNPAVTLGFAVAKRFPWRYVLGYWGAQFLGAVLAAGMARLLYGHAAGAHLPADPSAVLRNVGSEGMVTFLLMFVIIAVATDRRVPSSVPALAIGLAVVVGVLVSGPVTGGSMNPARSFGPALFGPSAALANLWLYFFAPSAGAVLAAVLYEFLRLDPSHAQSAPNELLEALSDIAAAKT